MIQLAIFGSLVGAVFGLRLRVMALLPVTVIGGASIGAGALLMNQPASSSFAAVLAWTLAVQAGFLLGSLSRFTVAAARASRPSPKRAAVETAR